MAEQQARPANDGEEALEKLSEILAADHLLDTIVAHEREKHPAEASDGEMGEETERAERPEPGASGLSKAEYDEATEQAVKDRHG